VAAMLCLGALVASTHAFDPLSQASHRVEPLSRALHRDRWDWNWACSNDANCNNLGTCDLISGKCACHVTYYGQRCELKRCPVSKLNEFECAGHGACLASNLKTNEFPSIHTVAGETARFGTCSCEAGWSGPACDTRACRDDCAPYGELRGTCRENIQDFRGKLTFDTNYHATCDCFPGYYGYSCEFKHCPTSPRGYQCDTAQSLFTAEVNGYCDRRAGQCLCSGDSYGPACEYRRCPGETRSLNTGSDRRSPEFDFQRQYYAPVDTVHGHAVNPTKVDHSLASPSAVWNGYPGVSEPWANRLPGSSGDPTMTHSGAKARQWFRHH